VFGFFWWFLWAFWIVAYFYVVWMVLSDLFRDGKLNGWWKALWIVCLIFFPFVTGIVYVIVRGSGMAERAHARYVQAPEQDDYRPAASSSPAEDIARAKALLDAGTISQGEFDALKSKALGNQFFGA
jgi:hypothetical protein